MRFQKGQKVSFLNDVGGGEVVNYVDDHTVNVLTDDGFECSYPERELVATVQREQYDASSTAYAPEKSWGSAVTQRRAKERGTSEVMEVDLHIEELVDSTLGMDNFDIVQLQLNTFKAKMELAREKHLRKLIVIHGVGEGVLRREIRHLLEGWDNIEYNDASYQKYGFGATEVRLYYK